MTTEQKLAIMQNMYAGMLTDSMVQFTRLGLTKEVEDFKIDNTRKVAGLLIKTLDIKEVPEAFIKIADVFNCAQWEQEEENVFVSKSCKLISLCKTIKTDSPCNMYCLNPLKSIIEKLDESVKFTVESTLFDKNKCRVRLEK